METVCIKKIGNRYGAMTLHKFKAAFKLSFQAAELTSHLSQPQHFPPLWFPLRYFIRKIFIDEYTCVSESEGQTQSFTAYKEKTMFLVFPEHTENA